MWRNKVSNKYSDIVDVKGFKFYKSFQKIISDIDNFEVDERDIWICSFPKCGTTWLSEMVWLIVNDLDYEGAKKIISERVPFFEVSGMTRIKDLLEAKEEATSTQPLLNRYENSVKLIKAFRSPVCIKTHLPYSLMPRQIQNNEKKPKIIYLIRNPEDTCVSYYNHYKLFEKYEGSLDVFCQHFIDGEIIFTPYWKHVLPYWRLRNEPNVLFLRFEEMKNDLAGVIRRVAFFLEKSLEDNQIEILKNHLSFESMKKNPATNYESLVEFLQDKFDLGEPGRKFMRSGQVGGYKKEMSPEFIEKFKKWNQENIKGTDYLLNIEFKQK